MTLATLESLPPSGRLLGVDLGEVRIGLAVTDPDQTIASPAGTLPSLRGARAEEVASQLAEAVSDRAAAGVVIGYPRTLAGREGRAARRARQVAESLAALAGVAVVLVDERFTTVEAERVMIEQDASRSERRRAIDPVAASLILQHALERRRRS